MPFSRILVACLVVIGLTGCGRDGPPDEAIVSEIEEWTPFKLTLSNVEVMPLAPYVFLGKNGATHRVVYHGTVSLTEPLWKKINTTQELKNRGIKVMPSHNFIIKTAESGSKAKVMGGCSAQKLFNKWDINCEKFRDMVPKIDGERLSEINEKNKYLESTPENVKTYIDEISKYQRANEKATAEVKVGNYTGALRLQEASTAALEKAETLAAGKPGAASTEAFIALAWTALVAKDFDTALSASKQALAASEAFDAREKKTWQLMATKNLAHATMCLGHTDEAKIIYLQHHGKTYDNGRMYEVGRWDDVIIKDIKELDAAGVKCPRMAELLSVVARNSVENAEERRNGCESGARSMWQGSRRWGAIAVGDTACGYSWRAETQEEAAQAALRECNKRTTSCTITKYNK